MLARKLLAWGLSVSSREDKTSIHYTMANSTRKYTIRHCVVWAPTVSPNQLWMVMEKTGKTPWLRTIRSVEDLGRTLCTFTLPGKMNCFIAGLSHLGYKWNGRHAEECGPL